MKTEVIFGQKPINPDSSYIELKLDGNKLQVDLCNEGTHSVWHLIMNDVSKYDALKEEFTKAAKEIFAEAGDIGYFIDVIQGQDIHDNYDLEYDNPSCDTDVLVSMEDIDKYIEEVETRLIVHYTQDGLWTDISDKSETEINVMCRACGVNPRKPLEHISEDWWRGVLATLRWITTNDTKFDDDVLG